MEILYVRENILVKKINNYIAVVSIFIIIILVSASFYMHSVVTTSTPGDYSSLLSTIYSLKDTYLSTFLTLICLVSFQVMFYEYGKQYKYIGSEGNEEFLKFILININTLV